jgi:CubicO group peptidase (beta-lactamase class C family)
MPTPEIGGFAAPRFAPLKDAFARSLAEGRELGARVSVVEAGEVVADLWGGFADRDRTRPFAIDTLTPVFSTTKAVAAVMAARLVEQGRLAYAQPVADLWPDFAQAGKGAVTVDQALSHQAGLSGFPEPMDPADWFDWDLICARLAAMTPLWPPGTASGYHPVTFGYLAGEIFRRADGRTLGAALREDVAGPAGLDLWIGLPDAEHGRVAEMERPKSLPRFGELNPATQAAFLTRWASPGGRGSAEWRRAEIPSANGHATALALARLMGALADDGRVDGVEVLSHTGVEALSRERIAGRDLVLPFDLSWGAGVMRNAVDGVWGPSPRAFGHSGWGGSCAFADPDRRLGFAYVMNRQSAELIGDPRARALVAAAYAG